MTTLSLDFTQDADELAKYIADTYALWNNARTEWRSECQELREYIVATDTTKTTNAKLPWSNKTTVPKLTQIRDNLHANYMAALFPNDTWLSWSGDDEDSASVDKRRVIEAYSRLKLNNTEFKEQISDLVLDYIDYGNAFALTYFEKNYKVDAATGEQIQGFIGPRLMRISPLDVVFNPTATSFMKSPKIIRYLKTIGELRMDMESNPDLNYDANVLKKVIDNRSEFFSLSAEDQVKAAGYIADGFGGDYRAYLGSGKIELLEFWGDIYSPEEDKVYKDKVITVIDGSYILRNMDNPSWLGEAPIRHIAWRKRPDNLWGQGPLANLVGMQYRIDHLENLKADIFDLIARPPLKIVGEVRSIDWSPGGYVNCGDEGNVTEMPPNTAALNADMQITVLENRMEQLAGAPREAMGFRTPGEKTKFEMQVLEQGAGRIFNAKTAHFEANFLEPAVNAMFELAVRNFQAAEVIRVLNSETGLSAFMQITKEDITARGKLVPQGARHFAEDAKFVQEMSAFINSLGQDPGIRPHWSGKKMAERLLKRLGVPYMFKENVFIEEQFETQQFTQNMQEIFMQQAQVETEPQPEDFIG